MVRYSLHLTFVAFVTQHITGGGAQIVINPTVQLFFGLTVALGCKLQQVGQRVVAITERCARNPS